MENKNFNILIVDDIPYSSKIAEYILKKENYKIYTAHSGREALTKIGNTQFDLILLDVMMPKMNGFELCKKIKEKDSYKETPIIFLTARNDNDSIVKGFEAGAVDYILKPFNHEELTARIRTHLQLHYSHLKLQQEVKMREKAEESLRIANNTKDKFFTIIAHDMKSPFNGLLNLILILSEHEDDLEKDDFMKIIHKVQDSSEKVMNLLDNLLNWSKTQTGKIKVEKELLNLTNLIKENASILQPLAAGKDIKLTLNLPESCYAFADRQMVNTILRNLISNAIKFTPHYKEIKISAEVKSNLASVSITDEGIGISKEHLKRMFKIEEYSSTPGTDNEKGSGLGLNLCKEFIEMNSGKIEVISVPGKGSCFSFYLPAKEK